MADITGSTKRLIDGLKLGRKVGLEEAKTKDPELKKTFFKLIRTLEKQRKTPLIADLSEVLRPRKNKSFFKKKKFFK